MKAHGPAMSMTARSANTLSVQEQESSAGPRVSIIHRMRATKRADVVKLQPESEYVRSMRMINLLMSGQHAGYGMTA